MPVAQRPWAKYRAGAGSGGGGVWQRIKPRVGLHTLGWGRRPHLGLVWPSWAGLGWVLVWKAFEIFTKPENTFYFQTYFPHETRCVDSTTARFLSLLTAAKMEQKNLKWSHLEFECH